MCLYVFSLKFKNRNYEKHCKRNCIHRQAIYAKFLPFNGNMFLWKSTISGINEIFLFTLSGGILKIKMFLPIQTNKKVIFQFRKIEISS